MTVRVKRGNLLYSGTLHAQGTQLEIKDSDFQRLQKRGLVEPADDFVLPSIDESLGKRKK